MIRGREEGEACLIHNCFVWWEERTRWTVMNHHQLSLMRVGV
jgi:hypothetical protein